jgi:hypothetical protein
MVFGLLQTSPMVREFVHTSNLHNIVELNIADELRITGRQHWRRLQARNARNSDDTAHTDPEALVRAGARVRPETQVRLALEAPDVQ